MIGGITIVGGNWGAAPTFEGSQTFVGDVSATGNISFESGTGFDGLLDHAITAPRTWTFPDASGTILTVSSLTEGSILFAGADGVVSEDNAGLFWDDTNDRLGIGTNAFDANPRLVIAHTDIALPSTDAANVRIITTDTAAADKGGILGLGGNQDGGHIDTFALLKGAANSSSGRAGYLVLATRNATSGLEEAMRIFSGRNVSIGTSFDLGKLTVVNDAASEVVIRGRAAASQTGALLRLEADDGTPIAEIVGVDAPILRANSSDLLSGLRIDVENAGADSLLRVQDNGTTIFTIQKNGKLVFGVGAGSSVADITPTSDIPVSNPATDAPAGWIEITDGAGNTRYIPIYT